LGIKNCNIVLHDTLPNPCKKGYASHEWWVYQINEWEGEPKVMEPDKCERWDWYDMDELPSPLFATVPSYVEAYKTGRNFWDQ